MIMVKLRLRIVETFGQDYKIIFGCFIVSVLFFGIFAYPNFATDTYFDATETTGEVVKVFLQNGRLFTAAFAAIFKGVLGLGIAWQLRISYSIAIVVTTLSIYTVYKILCNLVRTTKSISKSASIGILLVAAIIIINPFYINYYAFYEQGIMCLGVLLSALAALSFSHFLTSKSKSYLVLCLTFNALSLLCYQGCYGTFLVLACFVIISKTDNTKDLLKYVVFSGICYGMPALIEIIAIKIIGNSRAASHFDLFDSLQTIISRRNGTFNFHNILIPHFLLILITLLTFIVTIECTIAKSYHKLWKFLLRAAFIFAICLLAALVPILAENTNAINLAPRVVYPFGTVIGLWLATTYIICSNRRSILAIIATTVAILIIEWYRFNSIAVGRQQANALDRYKVSQIQNEITSYETAYNRQIKQISFVITNSPGDPYPINNLAGINLSAFRTNWSDAAIINLYTGRHYKRVKATNEQADHCLQHAKPIFTADQIKFDGDKAIICSY